MARALQIPELADGGYWYVARVVTDEEGGTGPDLTAPGWCAWYGEVGGTLYAAVRTPDMVDVDEVPVTVAEVLAAAYAAGTIPIEARPYGRIGGR